MKVKEKDGQPGKLQKAVPFPHSKHAVVECKECHHTMDKDGGKISAYRRRLSWTPWKPRKDAVDIKLVENAFHNQCIECHKNMKKENKPTGPSARGKCHTK